MNQATVRNNPDPRQQVLSAVQAADSVLLFCHVSPDGDTLGSALALKLRLTAMGKSVRLLVDGEVPSNLAFLSRMGATERQGWTALLRPRAAAQTFPSPSDAI